MSTILSPIGPKCETPSNLPSAENATRLLPNGTLTGGSIPLNVRAFHSRRYSSPIPTLASVDPVGSKVENTEFSFAFHDRTRRDRGTESHIESCPGMPPIAKWRLSAENARLDTTKGVGKVARRFKRGSSVQRPIAWSSNTEARTLPSGLKPKFFVVFLASIACATS